MGGRRLSDAGTVASLDLLDPVAIDPSGKERFAASPMNGHTSNGTAYLPIAQQAEWSRVIALVARQLVR